MIEIDECGSVSLVAEDGAEVTITSRRDEKGILFVTLYLSDGVNVTHIAIPRRVFDELMTEMRTMQ